MKSFFGFLGCIGIAALLAYYITGTGGLFILFLMIIALVLDLLISAVSSRKLKINLTVNSEIINKGEKVNVRITPDNGTVLPSGIIQVEIGCTPNMSAAEKDDECIYRFVTAGNNPEFVNVEMNADYCGLGKVFVKKLTVSDFLGIRHKEISTQSQCFVKIMPPVPDAGTQNEVIKSVSENMTFDDSEEESDETSLVPTGIPGYDHRPYVPGDPLKRINWKISSKKGNLMVRLDEKTVTSSQVFQLDFPLVNEMTREYYKNADKIICAGLAMLSMLLKQGYESEYIFCIDGQWEKVSVTDEKSLEYIQEKLAQITPVTQENRFPPEILNKKGKGVICFTAITGNMLSMFRTLAENINGTIAVTKESGIAKSEGTDIWSCDDDFSFSKL